MHEHMYDNLPIVHVLVQYVLNGLLDLQETVNPILLYPKATGFQQSIRFFKGPMAQGFYIAFTPLHLEQGGCQQITVFVYVTPCYRYWKHFIHVLSMLALAQVLIYTIGWCGLGGVLHLV